MSGLSLASKLVGVKKRFLYVQRRRFVHRSIIPGRIVGRPGIQGTRGQQQTHFRSSEHPGAGAHSRPAYTRSIRTSKGSRENNLAVDNAAQSRDMVVLLRRTCSVLTRVTSQSKLCQQNTICVRRLET